MKQSVLRSLSKKDAALLVETKQKHLDALDEDALIELHQRVRRARNKNVKNYRRGAADRVTSTGSRGGAGPGNQRSRDRAEALEDALSRVSGQLARQARRSANALREERLAAARGNRRSGPARGAPGAKGKPADRADDRRPTTPVRKKRAAGDAATGARRQARKDNR